MVIGVGQIGCGYEAQLESWYRFLVDPEPYEITSVDERRSRPRGASTPSLLQQRTAFLRPELAARDHHADGRERLLHPASAGQFYYAAQQNDRNNATNVPAAARRARSARRTRTTSAASRAARTRRG